MRTLLTIVFLCSIQLCFSQFITYEQAKEDFKEFKVLMEEQSSYYQLANYDIESHYQRLDQEFGKMDSVFIPSMAYEMEKIIAKTIDRHANIKIGDFEEDEIELFNLYFPFATAPFGGKAVALKRIKEAATFGYYDEEYPYLKQIDGLEVEDFLSKYAYRRNNSPRAARLLSGLHDLRKIGELYYKQGDFNKRKVQVVLTNGRKDKKLNLSLGKDKYNWSDMGSFTNNMELQLKLWKAEPIDYHQLDRWLSDSVAYLGIPEMISYRDYPDFEEYLEATISEFRKARALVIDIRGNGGGTREILNTLSKYLIPKESSPWVANVAYIRNDQNLNEDIPSMQGRFLYNRNSKFLSKKAKRAIEVFSSSFESELKIDPDKFSHPFYMVLESGPNPLDCPIYILTNEEVFSAASVFATAFKGLPNVKLAGVTTNGSSGRSRKFYLAHSGIRVKLSTMVSLQRNGKTLDGNGTEPDILIERNEAQVMGKEDYQLGKLVEMIGRESGRQ